ncbi:MAG: hypothetical protein E6K54_07745 [Gammaproteobacteria bacterium]|nr:MAG: hypothetical protein E6K54_07745 [Gammaproteobacteria bacterium]
MEVNQKQAFFASLAVIAETVNRKVSLVLMKAYWVCLKDYSFTEVQRALSEVLKNPHAKKHPYFPLPADVVEIIEGDINSKSLFAWTEVMKAIRQIGHYDSVVFSDKLIHAVIQDMGGWIALCQHNEKELSFVQRDFERRYQIYCRRRPKILPKHLTGFIAHQNAINGHEKSIPPAVVFSETRKTIKNKSLIMGN